MDHDLANLIRRAQKGDKDAFGEIYQLFQKRIFRFVYFSVRDNALAQDLTQNAFLRAWRSLGSFSLKRGSFQAFLFTIARNLVIDHTRKKKEISLELVGEVILRQDPDESLIKQEEKEMLYQKLYLLDDFERNVIILRYFEDLTYSEMAKILRKKEGAVRVRLHRILQKLKKLFEGH